MRPTSQGGALRASVITLTALPLMLLLLACAEAETVAPPPAAGTNNNTQIGENNNIFDPPDSGTPPDTGAGGGDLDTGDDDDDVLDDVSEDVPDDVEDIPDAIGDPCAPNPCVGENRTVCAPAEPDGHVCACDPGYALRNGGCQLEDVCAADTECAALGRVCEDNNGFAVCGDCLEGYERDGAACVPVATMCVDDCSGHGACDTSTPDPTCVCDDGYTGAACELCALGYQDNDGDGVCTESCARTDLDCGPRGQCEDISGTVGCLCDIGYVGAACDSCDAANGFHPGADGVCTSDLCDPDPCGQPGPCEGPGVCDPQTGTCTFPDTCVSVAGNWRWNFSSDSGNYITHVSLRNPEGTTTLTGQAIDEFGISTLTGELQALGSDAFTITKTYTVGASDGQFTYTGTFSGNTAFTGSWEQSDNADNNGSVTGTRQDLYDVALIDGAWIFDTNFGEINTTINVDDTGYFTGTMNDQFGAATIVGVFDRGSRTMRLHKVYTEGGADWWYVGTVSTSGTSLTAGSWGNESREADVTGSFTGRR